MRRGQISIEMILVLAAILAVAFILVTQLRKTAVKGGEMVESKSDEIMKMINETTTQISCESDIDCPGEMVCVDNVCVSSESA